MGFVTGIGLTGDERDGEAMQWRGGSQEGLSYLSGTEEAGIFTRVGTVRKQGGPAC